MKASNKNYNEVYLKMLNQMNRLKEKVVKTDKKIKEAEKEFESFRGLKPEMISTITLSQLNVFIFISFYVFMVLY